MITVFLTTILRGVGGWVSEPTLFTYLHQTQQNQFLFNVPLILLPRKHPPIFFFFLAVVDQQQSLANDSDLIFITSRKK
jgi:hypothetical protein